MKFEGKYVRSLSKLLGFTEKHPKVQFVFNVEGASPNRWLNLGFNQDLQPGDCLIPSAVGSVTRFNAHGRYVPRKDLPKIVKSFTVYSTSYDWHGNPHTGIRYWDREVYARDFIPAPSEMLFAVKLDTGLHLATREIDFPVEGEAAALHLANLMLECFGEFYAIDASSGALIGTKLRFLQWEVLPPGECPWSKASTHVQNFTQRLNNSNRELITQRMGTIAGYEPTFMATGKGGFNAYFVYGFEKKGVYVLESGYLDNATYVFREDWETLSKLSKNEIINGGVPHLRIVHDHRWQQNIHDAIYGT